MKQTIKNIIRPVYKKCRHLAARVLKFLDRKILNGKIFRRIERRRIEKSYPQRTQIAVVDLLLAQYDNSHFPEYCYYDLAPRLFAIEQFYDKNDFGYEMYRKMQDISGGGRWDASWLLRFQNLIKEYDKTKTFDEQYPIVCHVNNWQIKDGAHRLALAYYHGTEFVPVVIENLWRDRRWGFNWLWSGEFGEEKFTVNEIQTITNKTKKVLDSITYDFIGAIWPPAMPFKDEIINDLNAYGKMATQVGQPCGECHVIDYKDVEYDKAEFLGLMRMLYHEDIITEENLIRKYHLIFDAMSERTEMLPVRLFRMHIEHPCIERREENNSAQSKSVVNIKQAIRKRYQDRIPYYQYDICFHLSDNYQQSKFCKIALDMDRDISDLFKAIDKQWKYVICKTEKRISPDFPYYYYYYYSDADILLNQENIEECAAYVEKWLKEKYTDPWYSVELRKGNNKNIGVILYLHGCRCLYIDLQTTEEFGLALPFNSTCINNRVLSKNAGYYELPPQIDIIIRAAEYVRTPHKLWHKDYIKEHITDYREDIFNLAFGNINEEFAQKVKQCINYIQNEK